MSKDINVADILTKLLARIAEFIYVDKIKTGLDALIETEPLMLRDEG